MIFFPMGSGTGILPLLFLMFFVVPAAMRLMASFSGGHTQTLVRDDEAQGWGQITRSAPVPAQDPKAMFAQAKRDFPGQLIDFDNKLGEAEEFGINLNGGELKSARDHLNKAFAGYAQHFQGDAPVTNDVAGAIKAVSNNLKSAERHLLLADPNTAGQVADMDEKARLAAAEAGRVAAARAKAQADLAAQNQDGFFGMPTMVRPVQRQTSVRLTPFGIMIGSF